MMTFYHLRIMDKLPQRFLVSSMLINILFYLVNDHIFPLLLEKNASNVHITCYMKTAKRKHDELFASLPLEI